MKNWFANSPWWLVSAGLHLMVLLGAALVYVEQLVAIDVVTPYVGLRPELPPPIDRIDRPRDVDVRTTTPPVDSDVKSETFLFNPFARPSDREESANNDPSRELLGQSREAYSWQAGEAPGLQGQGKKHPGLSGTLGVGGGDGFSKRKGGIRGGMEDLAPPGAPPPRGEAESSVAAALRWLLRHQNPDGSWGAHAGQCRGTACSGDGERSFDTGVTSLSLLAFLGAGYSHLSQDDQTVPGAGSAVKRGLMWLADHQDPEGCVGERGPKFMYNHAIAALALSEAYGMTSTDVIRSRAQLAIDFLIASQNPGKAWRYSSQPGDNDSSVSGWAVMALKSAELSDLKFPHRSFEGALQWFQEATERDGYFRVGYTKAGTGKVFVPGKNEQFSDHPSMSAVSILSRIFISRNRKDPAFTAVNLLAADLPAYTPGQVDFYYWYYASLALFQYDGPSGPFWKRWNEPMKAALVPHQKGAAAGCENGSWNPADDRWGFEGGRVYATAINALTLEVYYRYANVFGSARK